MLGYIYYITNKVNKKQYIGETINFEERKAKHLAALRSNKHHSIKLQRAYNKYGEENFEWSWDIYDVSNEKDLKLLEQEKISYYNTYENGYNCTQGGDGNVLLFDYNTSCALYYVLQRYDGVSRQIARYYNCDHTTIDALKRNSIYADISPNEEQIEHLIKELNLSDSNLKENYKPHNARKLNQEQVFEILSIILTEVGYDRLVADTFQVHTKLISRLKKGEIYLDCIEEYYKLTDIEKEKIKQNTLEKYDLEHNRLARKRNSAKVSPLTQEQVNYILDNQNMKKQIEIAADLQISADRISSVIRGKSYKDLVNNYYSSKQTNCHE